MAFLNMLKDWWDAIIAVGPFGIIVLETLIIGVFVWKYMIKKEEKVEVSFPEDHINKEDVEMICKLIKGVNVDVKEAIKKIGGVWHGLQALTKDVKEIEEHLDEIDKTDVKSATEQQQIMRSIELVTTKMMEITGTFKVFIESLKSMGE